jgi:antitoxin component HigA of HigAB toxin-antitoxin module
VEGGRLDVLTTLVKAYEHDNFPMDLPDVVESQVQDETAMFDC